MNHIYTTEELKTLLTPIFDRYPIKRAYLFGSYAYGNPSLDSDVDIIIDTQGRMSFLRVCGVGEELRQTLHKPVDLFDLRELEHDSPLYLDIHTKGIPIYEAR